MSHSDDAKTAVPRFRAVRATGQWLARPGLKFMHLSANPMLLVGTLYRNVIGPELAHRREVADTAKAVGHEIDRLHIDPTLRDRSLFEGYCLAYDLDDETLRNQHNGATALAYRYVLVMLLALTVIAVLYVKSADAGLYLFRVAEHFPILVGLAVTPWLVVVVLTVVRYLFHAFCIRSRRNGSLDSFALWATSPREWFCNPFLRQLPAVKALPDEVMATLKNEVR